MKVACFPPACSPRKPIYLDVGRSCTPMSLLWLRIAVFLYGVAALTVLPAALYDRPRWRHIAIPCGRRGGAFSLRLAD